MTPAKKVRSISVKGGHGHLDIGVSFAEDTSIVFGDNGAGKTTLLHILANFLHRDYSRFKELTFKEIIIVFDNSKLEIRRITNLSFPDESSGQIEFYMDHKRFLILDTEDAPRSSSETVRTADEPTTSLPRCLYIPAYRSVIDSWKSNLSPIPDQVIDAFIRKWGNPFWPNSTFPSLGDIEAALRSMPHSNTVKSFIALVNQFLVNKRIEISSDNDRTGAIDLVYQNSSMRSKGIAALSSGERQLVTLLYATSALSGSEIVLIDEPEISLDVTWQRRLVEVMRNQIGGGQLIICTHSPMIGGSHLDRVISLSEKPIESSHNQDIPY